MGMDAEVLLWPEGTALPVLAGLVRPRNQITAVDSTTIDSDELLWPALLINQQARAHKAKSLALPFSIASFLISIVLGIIVEPLQVALLATTKYNYDWVTTVYYPAALKYVLLAAAFLAIFNFIILVLAWRDAPRQTRLTSVLSLGSLMQIGLIWLLSIFSDLPPHFASMVLFAASVSFLVVTILLWRNPTAKLRNGHAMQIFLGFLMILSLVESIGGVVYFANANQRVDSSEVDRITTAQAHAQLAGVSRELSDAVYTLCQSPYQIIYLTTDKTSGLFECTNSGEVYSVMEITQTHPQSLDSAATYLGTTRDVTISAAFPDAHYLYRSIPQVLSEQELALMVPGNSEEELLDIITQPLLDYWQNHNAFNLYLNIFYTRDVSTIFSTKDFILMAALDTMAMVDKLPQGNTISGYHSGKSISYLYQPDRELKALHELAAQPELTSADSLDALTFRRHIAIHFTAGESFDYETLRTRLSESFVGGA